MLPRNDFHYKVIGVRNTFHIAVQVDPHYKGQQCTESSEDNLLTKENLHTLYHCQCLAATREKHFRQCMQISAHLKYKAKSVARIALSSIFKTVAYLVGVSPFRI